VNTAALPDEALDRIFRRARSYPTWQRRPVPDALLREVYELLKWGPTSMNSMPARFVFLRTPEAKARLVPALAPGNVQKVRDAPVTVIVAYDNRFHEHLPVLWPHSPDAHRKYANSATLAETTAFRNSTLQGAYLIVAARALGLDAGPMSGFVNEKVDAEFFPAGRYRSNFLVNLGYGDPAGLHPRGRRLGFGQAAELL
jgi:3-hydroxypropanoate dehydrogenase